jgi:hypothetical protein
MRRLNRPRHLRVQQASRMARSSGWNNRSLGRSNGMELSDPDQTAAHLEQAEQHLREGQWRLERQRELVKQLERNGRSLDQAKILLRQFELMQATNVERLARLRKEVERASVAEPIGAIGVSV